MKNIDISTVEEECIKVEVKNAIIKFMIENNYLDQLNIFYPDPNGYLYCTQDGFQLDFSILELNIVPIEIVPPIYTLNIRWELPIVVQRRIESLESHNPYKLPIKGHLSDIKVELLYNKVNGTPSATILTNISNLGDGIIQSK